MTGIRRGERFGAGSQVESTAAIHDDDWKQIMGLTSRLPISKIRRDGGTQPRTALDSDTISEYVEAMENGAKFPPVDVFYDGVDYWLADGFHRIEAAKHIGRDEFDVKTHQGTRRDAILFSTGVNATHGLRRTSADKRRAVFTLLEDAEWGGWNNSEIARQCHVDEKTVRNLRDSSLTSENPKLGETREEKRMVQRGAETYQMKPRKKTAKGAKRGSSHKVSQLIPDSDRPAELPADSDRLAQPPAEMEGQQAVIYHLRQAIEGLARYEGYEVEAQQLADFVDVLVREWGIEE